MASRVETEAALNKEHALREVRRASTYLLNVVVAGLILAAGAVPQLVAGEFMPLIFAVSVAVLWRCCSVCALRSTGTGRWSCDWGTSTA